MSGPGKTYVIQQNRNSVSARLYNFGIGKDVLKIEHKTWLVSNVVGLLKGRGSISLTGLASRTDTDTFNMSLSIRRAESVISFLRTHSPNNFKVEFQIAAGERAAQFAGVKDGVEDENWRPESLRPLRKHQFLSK
jgi:outer membrane protein OmpA-like peptidoglycan-associated protein